MKNLKAELEESISKSSATDYEKGNILYFAEELSRKQEGDTPNTKQPSGNTGEFKQELREQVNKWVCEAHYTGDLDGQSKFGPVNGREPYTMQAVTDQIMQLLSDTVNKVLDELEKHWQTVTDSSGHPTDAITVSDLQNLKEKYKS